MCLYRCVIYSMLTIRMTPTEMIGSHAGTGDVLKVQSLLHICSEHFGEKPEETSKEEEKDKKEQPQVDPGSLNEPGAQQAFAVLGLALISVGEDIGSEMALRTYSHLVSKKSLQCHAPYIATPLTLPRPLHCHAPYIAMPLTMPCPLQCHAPYIAMPLTIPRPLHCHAPYNTTSITLPCPLQCHAHYIATPITVPRPLQCHAPDCWPSRSFPYIATLWRTSYQASCSTCTRATVCLPSGSEHHGHTEQVLPRQ